MVAKTDDKKLEELVAKSVAKVLGMPAPPEKKVMQMCHIAANQSATLSSGLIYTNPYPYEIKLTIEVA